ncbi:hypothetical protein AYO44_05865 [Planctomycetaceae bacterium SCGC AG-212-F19]|nr:hypothetical protein AYO44_05865 [Planctomycetaceae bacterium SCGC AG-212-F19]
MKLDSREYQCQLDRLRFPDRRTGIQAFFAFVRDFDPHVTLHTNKRKDTEFEEYFFDTAGGDIAEHQVHLRVRVFLDHISCTHKAIARDRYCLKKMRVGCSAKDATIKLEEDIYGYHSMFAWEMTCNQPLGKRFATVGDWAKLFAGTEDVCPTDMPLVAGSSRFFYQVAQIEIHFDEHKKNKKHKAPATLELKYDDAGHQKLLAVEFAWKHIESAEEFAANQVRRMRQFFAALYRSPWADASSDLAKCQAQRL